MIKIAFISKPRLSGDYTHFKYLRDNLQQFKFYLVGLGDLGQLDEIDDDFIHLGSNLDRKSHQKEIADLFVKFHKEESLDIIIPVDSAIVISCIPFLENVRIVNIVNLDSKRLYKYVTSYLDYVSKIICISARQVDVLKSRLSRSLFVEKVILIPHGVKRTTNEELIYHADTLRIGFIGRMHHGHKGIFWIPKILRMLKIPFRFELVGEGKDHQNLLDQLEKYQIDYTSHGYVSPDNINIYLHKWDVLLFPSQIEGFGLTLVEAMNNGVVPIANRLPGITDYIIDSGTDGFVVTKNRVKEFVERIHSLDKDRDLLLRMKTAAIQKVENHFNLQLILDQYVRVFEEVMQDERVGKTKDFSEWKPFVEYTPSLPTKLMNRLRKLRDIVINQVS
jgi:hypothetical protein